MVSVVRSAGIAGIDGYVITAECDLSGGLPAFEIVGLPDAAVRESRDRVRAAVKNCGFDFPLSRVTVNLAPADVRKEGPMYDLPLLLGILTAAGQIPPLPEGAAFLGELSLSGELRQVSGVLPMALACAKAGLAALYLPADNAPEAAYAEGLAVYPVHTVGELLAALSGRGDIAPAAPPPEPENPYQGLDFADVKGQANVKRALEVAAAGGHNVLLSGSPGSGKSMMAKRLPGILPPMTREEKLEVIRVWSVTGRGKEAAGSGLRPFRAPHHTASPTSLIGGGARFPKPGEASLSHNGVLFLDELPEFRRDALEALRQPVEDGIVTISRIAGSAAYPSQFMLLCAMNPCKCGWYGHPSGRCRCSEESVRHYREKISGPLLDRIDIQLTVQPVPYEDLTLRPREETSDAIRQRVVKARLVQQQRYQGTGVTCNARLTPALMERSCPLDKDAEEMIAAAFRRLGMTARSYDRVLRLARTVADLGGHEKLTAADVAEAIQYRFSARS